MERLHIEYAKDAYKATNWKDEFAHMTLWLERKEKVLRHNMYMNWLTRKASPPPAAVPRLQMTKNPTRQEVHFDDLADNYGAYDIRNALAAFITKTNNPALSGMRLKREASEIILFLNRLPVFHKVRLANPNPQEWLETEKVRDIAHARPAWKTSCNRVAPGRFDMVLVNCREGGTFGVADTMAMFRFIFVLMNMALQDIRWLNSEFYSLFPIDSVKPFSRMVLSFPPTSLMLNGLLLSRVSLFQVIICTKYLAHLKTMNGIQVSFPWTTSNVA